MFDGFGWQDALVTTLMSVISSVVTGWGAFRYGSRKTKAEVEGIEISNARLIMNEYKELTDNFKKEMIEYRTSMEKSEEGMSALAIKLQEAHAQISNLQTHIEKLEAHIEGLEDEIMRLRSQITSLMVENQKLKGK